MKIKFSATINNMSLKKDGEYRLEFKIPLSEISEAVSTIRLLDTEFKIGILSEEKSKSIITEAYFYKLAIDREGESKVMVSFPCTSIDDGSLSFFGKHQNELINVIIKND